MISQEARDLFAANVKAMTAGDAAHLASQLLPDDVSRLKDIAYVHDGDAAHLLDIYTLADAEEGAALPVIVDFHGGGLYYGNKENNECRDMLLARQGFAVVNANYRLVPSVSFPAQLADAMAVLDWIRDHGAEYGLDAERVCVTGDSAGGALALYLCAANGSTQLAGALGLWQSGIEVHALVVTSGMFRLQGGVHANALSYYMEGYLQTPADHIKVNPYLDLDKLIVDGDVPPIYMITSAGPCVQHRPGRRSRSGRGTSGDLRYRRLLQALYLIAVRAAEPTVGVFYQCGTPPLCVVRSVMRDHSRNCSQSAQRYPSHRGRGISTSSQSAHMVLRFWPGVRSQRS